VRSELRQRLVAIGGAADLKALVGQCALQHPLELRIIVYDKYYGHSPSHHPADKSTSVLLCVL
jgi:hypothetical protein